MNSRRRRGKASTLQPVPLPSLCIMSSTRTECNAAKDRKSKRGSCNTSARPHNAQKKMLVGTASESCMPSSSSLPSTSSLALPLQPALAGSPPDAGLSFMEQTTPLSDSKGTKQRDIQKKFSGGKTHSMQTRNQRKIAAAAAQVEPLRLDDRSVDEEVIDLTCETSDPIVVDLTYNDSVLVGESGQQPNREFRCQPLSDSLILSSDDDDGDSRHTESDALATRKLPREEGREEFASSKSSGTVTCPICIESYAEIMQSGRLIVSTKCGHIFCSLCLTNSLGRANFCPTCRRELTQKEYHPIYI